MYIKGNLVEGARVLFDKIGVIRYKEYRPEEFTAENGKRLAECEYLMSQPMRVLKYVYRGQYPEAFAYYNKYAVKPLVDALRVIYTPANADYHLVHISNHIPKEDCVKLEYFLKITSVEDIAERVGKAQEWFKELKAKYKGKEN